MSGGRTGAERHTRELVEFDVLPQPAREVAALVELRAQPRACAVRQHGVEDHQPLDHAAQRHRLSMSVVGLLDRGVQRLVMEVKQPAAVRRAGRDRTRVSALDEAPQEVGCFLSMGDAGEAAILALDEYAAVD
jgi:hypothetical protein